MRIEQILKACVEANVYLWAEAGQLKVQFKGVKLDPSLASLLKENKQALLTYLENNANKKVKALPTLDTRKPDEEFDACTSFGQSRLWFIDSLAKGNSQYNMLGTLSLKGEFNIDACRSALKVLLERHEILRTHFIEKEGQPYQRIKPVDEPAFKMIDWQSHEQTDSKVIDFIRQETQFSFDLAQGNLFRTHVLQCSDSEFVLVFNLHHIICDDWSVKNLVSEFAELYNSLTLNTQPKLSSLPVQYADFASWQKQWLETAEAKSGINFWTDYLSGAPELHSLPLDHPRPVKANYEGQALIFELGAERKAELQKLANQADTTLFVVLQSLFSVLLAKFGQQDDVVMGVPVAGRQHHDLDNLIGFFVNTIATRTQVNLSETFAALFERNRDNLLEAFNHQNIPFDMVVEALNPTRSLSYSPLFQIMFSLLENTDLPVQLNGLDVEEIDTDSHAAKFELQLTAINNGQLTLRWLFNPTLFDSATIEQLSQRFITLIDGVIADPSQSIGALPLLASQELVLLDKWGTADFQDFAHSDRVTPACLSDIAKHKPQQIAVAFEDSEINYGEFALRVERLASYLIGLGVQPGDRIALLLPRGIDAITAIYAVWQAGAAYVPIDVDYPQERVAYILADSEAKLVISHQSNQSLLTEAVAVYLDCQQTQQQISSVKAAPEVMIAPTQLAYIIYTSGSTGLPKGVMVNHGNLNNLREGLLQICTQQFSRFTSWAWNASYAFDSSLKAISLLSRGITLYVLSDDVRKQPEQLLNTFGHHAIDIYDCTPSQLEALLDLGSKEALCNLPNLALGGEPISTDLWNKIVQVCEQNNRRALNLYGPTECTVDTTFALVEKGTPPNIGRPLPGYICKVVDSVGQKVPIGAVGELWIGGTGVSNGYLNRDELTAEKFCVDDQDSALRFYKSGDLVRWNKSGVIQYVGRTDDQIKLRGYRIELSEIQTQVQSLPDIKENVVVVNKHNNSSLVCYFVGNTEVSWNDERCGQLQQQLSARLPQFMVPAVFIPVAQFSLTTNGKLDIRALPDPADHIATLGNGAQATTATEKAVEGIWKNLLNIESPSIDDNFFVSGGHSLLAARLIACISDELSVTVSLQQLFEAPTIRGLAANIEVLRDESGGAPQSKKIELNKQQLPEQIPLSFSQQKLWVLEQLMHTEGVQQNSGGIYNLVVGLKLKGALNIERLESALAKLLERHHSLRTKIKKTESGPYLAISPANEFVLAKEKLDNSEEKNSYIKNMLDQGGMHRFDLAHELPFKASLVELAKDEHVLIFVMHHIATDGWSSAVFIKELNALYADPHVALPELELQYADYSVWQQNMLQQKQFNASLSYWYDTLKGSPSFHSLPMIAPRPERQQFVGRHYHSQTGTELATQLHQCSQQHNVSLFMLLESAFALLVARWSNSDDVVIGVPVANRDIAGIENLVGFFVNTVALRSHVNNEMSFEEYLAANAQRIMEGFNHQHIPFELVVEKLNPARSNSHSPIFQIMFTLNNNEQVDLVLPDVVAEELEQENQVAKFELGVAVHERDGNVEIIWEYNTGLFDDAFIERFSASFNTLLSAIVKDPKANILALPVVSEAEQKLLAGWNNTQCQFQSPDSLVALLQNSVTDYPEHLAVTVGANQYTYNEINTKANQLANYILNEYGVVQHQLIGLCFARDVNALVAAIAVTKLGAAFVPIDPDFPAERVDYIVSDTNPPLLLTDKVGQTALSQVSGQIINVEAPEQAAALKLSSTENLDLDIKGSDLAYVIYTSGSTGQPKGVMVEHRNICNYLQAIKSMINQPEGGRYTSWTNYIFDYAISEWFVPLLHGGSLHILRNEQRTEPDVFFEYLLRENITATYVPPFFLKEFRNWLVEGKRTLQLKVMIVGLEPIDQALLEEIKSLVPGLNIYNGYGPTEATIACTFYSVQDHKSDSVLKSKNTPIGFPIDNVTHYVVNQQGQLAPIGVAGELLIGGKGLARGYLNKPDATKAGFVEHPFNPTETVYRTGDWVKYLTDGNIEFVGRIDNQVKISGLRVELGEIEVQMLNCPLVDQGAVVAKSMNNGDKKIVAFVIAKDECDFSDQAQFRLRLREHLKKKLPEFMVPSIIQLVQTLPMTASDKIDRKALMNQELTIESKNNEAPLVANKLAKDVHALWQDVLGVEQIGLDDNFFEIGGTSLNAVQLTNKIKGTIYPKISAVDIFANPTINSLVTLIAQSQKEPEPEQKQKAKNSHDASGTRDIAIVGMAGSFPKAENVSMFWHNLKEGIEGISFFDAQQLSDFGVPDSSINDPNYIAARGILDRSLEFDAALFDYKNREAELIDPQLRLLHECAWEALDNAGYGGDQHNRKIGIFGGASNNLLWMQQIFQQNSGIGSDIYDLATLSDREFFMSRVANKLNLTGPAVNIQTACSTSLVATHMAVQSLLSGDCDMALAGGVSMRANKEGYLYQEGMISSPDGHCRAFDAKAKGTVGGEGVGLVLLKRLDDA
ncbi:non-ribosomal peptide synthetase, partial [Pseudoalteromonas piscicida]